MEESPEDIAKPLGGSEIDSSPLAEISDDEVKGIIAALPVDDRKKLARVILERSVLARTHRGPLPDPEDLKKYCELIPNGGERIMARYEKQSDHRIEIESSTIKIQCHQSSVGQWMGFVLGVLGLSIGGVCIYAGHDAAGATLGGATLVGLVSVFVAGKTEIFRSLAQKHPRTKPSEGGEASAPNANSQLKMDD
jgi:uncharacterized membrane protein